MLLASRCDVPLGYWNGLGILPLAVEAAHLAIQISKYIDGLRLSPEPDAYNEHNQHD